MTLPRRAEQSDLELVMVPLMRLNSVMDQLAAWAAPVDLSQAPHDPPTVPGASADAQAKLATPAGRVATVLWLRQYAGSRVGVARFVAAYAAGQPMTARDAAEVFHGTVRIVGGLVRRLDRLDHSGRPARAARLRPPERPGRSADRKR